MSGADKSRPFIFYFLQVFLTVGWSFIGWNFAGVSGLAICLFVALVVNIYALTIPNEE